MSRTEISTLGEFGLIRRIAETIELKNESSVCGIGDDAAASVMIFRSEKCMEFITASVKR